MDPRGELTQSVDPVLCLADGTADEVFGLFWLCCPFLFGTPKVQESVQELLLRAVVQVAREPCARRVARFDDPALPGAGFGRARLGDVALAGHLREAPTLFDVREGDHGPASGGRLDRRRPVFDREHRAVAADEPVLVGVDRFAGLARAQHRAVLNWVRCAVGMLVVDRLVAGLALKFGSLVVAERRDRGWVGEADVPRRVDDPDRLGDPHQD